MIITARSIPSLKSLATFTLIAGFILIAGCTSSNKAPTSDSLPPSKEANQNQTANQTVKPNDDNNLQSSPLFDNANPYKNQPSQSPGDLLSDPNQPPLNQVEGLVQNKLYNQALSIAQRIDRNRLSLQEQSRLSLAEAQIFSATSQNQQALQSLELIKPSLLSIENNSRFFWLKARTKYQLGDFQGALEALADRENYLSAQEIPVNQQMMQSILSALSPEEQQTLSKTTQNPNLLYWLGSINLSQTDNQGLTQAPPIANPNQAAKISSIWQANSPRQIAILLPYSSNFAAAAKEFESGFNQAHAANLDNNRPQLRFYDVGSGDIQRKISIAIQNGANFIIGPLGKNASETALNINAQVPILTLGGQNYNQSNKFTFSLSPEAEGAAIAQHARGKGLKNAIILTPNTPRSARLSNAFQATWQSLGGTTQIYEIAQGEYDHSATVKLALGIYGSEQRHSELSNIIGSRPKFNVSRKDSIDMILLASSYEDTKNLKPQLNFFDAHAVPTYGASSLNRSSAPTGEKADLDGLIIPEMPALVTDNNGTINNQKTISRLQALGFDSYQLIPIINELQTQQSSYQGKTGQLFIDTLGNTIRIPSWAKFSSGVLTPIPNN